MAHRAALRSAARSRAGRQALCGPAGSGRTFASKAPDRILLHGVHDLPAAPQGIIEMREYQLQPASLKPYLELLAKHIERRKQLSPLLGMFTCDTGGSLTSVLHLYHYRDLSHREMARAAAARDASWQRDMIDAGRHAGIVYQASSIFRHANYAELGAELQLPQGMRSAAAFQPRASRPDTGGSDRKGSKHSADGKTAQRGTYVLAIHQPESWGLQGAAVTSRLAALGCSARILGAKAAPELAFKGSTVLGTQQVLELHRFQTTADVDVCINNVDLFTATCGPASTLRLMKPLPFSPWQ